VRALLQRVSQASVEVEGQEISSIGLGWLVLLGVGQGDAESTARLLAQRVVELRCFEDENGKTNLAAGDVGAELLVVSQFTLYANTTRGRRPSFTEAAPPGPAAELVDVFVECVRDRGFTVRTGQFGAMMRVSLINEGPFTIWLDTASPG
jgi:D-tyrosyl-tRNA(Tyr) deacylase